MAGFFSRFFGGKDKTTKSEVQTIVEKTLEGIIKAGGFSIEFETKLVSEENENTLYVNLTGKDEELFKDYKGQVLDSLQLLLKRVVQHHLADDRTNIEVDCGGFKEENMQALIERAENLKTIAIEQNKSVYYRALPPKERKVVHQYLAKDPRVKSRSLGDGLYKKIKIFPANETAR
jgi:spoIIIJ-associated protein